MSGTIAALFDEPTEIRIGGTAIKARPLRLKDMIELEEFAKAISPDTAEEPPSIYEMGTGAIRDSRMVAAMIRACGRASHPELESDPALAPALADLITPTQFKVLMEVAFAEPSPPKA